MLKTKFKVYTTQKIRLCAKHRQTDKGLTPDVKFITDHNCTVKKDKKATRGCAVWRLEKKCQSDSKCVSSSRSKSTKKRSELIEVYICLGQ